MLKKDYNIKMNIIILEQVRNLLSDPQRWIKGDLALDKLGKITRPESPDAVCWCLTGALEKCTFYISEEYTDLLLFLRELIKPNYTNVVGFNDAPETTHEDIMKLLNKAIKVLEVNMSESIKRLVSP